MTSNDSNHHDTSLVGRGPEAMVPEEGLPFDVSRRRGRGAVDHGSGTGPGFPDDPAALRRETVAAVFDAMDWSASAGEASPAPALDQPATRYFVAFPWTGAAAAGPSPPQSNPPQPRDEAGETR